MSDLAAAIRELHETSDGVWCDHCTFSWPCATIRLLDGEPTPVAVLKSALFDVESEIADLQAEAARLSAEIERREPQ